MNCWTSKTSNLPYWALNLANKWLKKTLWTKIGILYQCALAILYPWQDKIVVIEKFMILKLLLLTENFKDCKTF